MKTTVQTNYAHLEVIATVEKLAGVTRIEYESICDSSGTEFVTGALILDNINKLVLSKV